MYNNYNTKNNLQCICKLFAGHFLYFTHIIHHTIMQCTLKINHDFSSKLYLTLLFLINFLWLCDKLVFQEKKQWQTHTESHTNKLLNTAQENINKKEKKIDELNYLNNQLHEKIKHLENQIR